MDIKKNFDEKTASLKHLGEVLPNVEGFGENEKIICPKCGRQIPPTRESCLYCGAVIEIPDDLQRFVRPAKQDLEDWEKGWSVCVAPFEDEISAENERFLTSALRLEPEILSNLLKSRTFLPLMRAADERNAQIAVERLRENGIESHIVADETLREDVLPKRARFISFDRENCFVSQILCDEEISFAWHDVHLIVVGQLFESEMQIVDLISKKQPKEEAEISEFSDFEDVLDIYTPQFPEGIRIAANHFDFSALGSRKKFTARENFQELLEVLRENAFKAVFNNSYKNCKKLISHVWLLSQKQDSKGLVRKNFGKFAQDKAIKTDNLQQFTKFSRMNDLFARSLKEETPTSAAAENYEQKQPPTFS